LVGYKKAIWPGKAVHLAGAEIVIELEDASDTSSSSTTTTITRPHPKIGCDISGSRKRFENTPTQIPGKREGPKSNWMYAILDTNVLSKGLFGTPIWPIPWTAKNLSMIVGFARKDSLAPSCQRAGNLG
jgi:hypothetical protein